MKITYYVKVQHYHQIYYKFVISLGVALDEDIFIFEGIQAIYPEVLEIFKDQTKKMMDMMGGGMPDQEKMAALFKEQDDKLKKVLTEDQHKKWTDHMQQMMQNFGGGF